MRSCSVVENDCLSIAAAVVVVAAIDVVVYACYQSEIKPTLLILISKPITK